VAAVPAGLRYAALAGACLLIIGAALYVLIELLVRMAPLTLAIVAALLMTALIAPVTDGLDRLGVPRSLAALAGLLALLAAIVLPLVLVGQRTAEQVPSLQQNLDKGLNRLRELALNGPIPIGERQLDAAITGLGNAARRAAPSPAAGAGTAVEVLGAALIALVLLFFFLKDGAAMWHWVLRLGPRRLRSRVDEAAVAGWQTLVAYVRGTVVIALVDAVGIGLAVLLLGVPLALPLALLTFIAAFIPIVGATVAGSVAVLVAFVSNGVTDALLVLLAVVLVQQAEGNLLQPLIMGRALRMHPAVVLVTVTAGTLLAGIAGAVVAVPITAVTYRFVMTLRASREKETTEDRPDPADSLDEEEPDRSPPPPQETAERSARPS
jgi:putative heme transporter